MRVGRRNAYYPPGRDGEREDALVMRRELDRLRSAPSLTWRRHDDVLAELGLLPRWQLRAEFAHRGDAAAP